MKSDQIEESGEYNDNNSVDKNICYAECLK